MNADGSSPPPTEPDVVIAAEETGGGFQRGALLARFFVLGSLGTGGMGIVLAGYDPELDRKVAIKLVRPDRRSQRERIRLIQEAQAMARLAHPNVVTVYEVGSIGEQMFVVMELVEGRTLREVLLLDRPPASEVLRLLCAAGDGLAAAHRAGTVHRDLKPDNILVGADGRPRVSDFGLAAAIRAADATTEGGPALASRFGGTPGYMAPEQARGEPSDARADQYAFCVTAFEALAGPGRSSDAATVEPGATSDGGAPMARPGVGDPRGVPRHVREALQRGLSPDPADRWPSMDALLAQLRRDPRVHRRRAAIAAVGLAAVGAAAFAIGRQDAAAPEALCTGGPQQIAGVWDDADRAIARPAFLATGLPFAAETFERVDRVLGERQAAWAAGYRSACEATRVHGEQSEALLDRRMQCLSRARAGMVAVVDAFRNAGARAVENALRAAAAAGDIDACADGAGLSAQVPRPSQPEMAHRLDAAEARVARLEVTYRIGHWDEGLAASAAVIAEARAAGWSPLLADALRIAALFEYDRGDGSAAYDHLVEAVRVAGEGGADLALARAVGDLLWLAKSRRTPAEARILLPVAWAAVHRAGDPPKLRATLLRVEGDLARRKGALDEALARYQESVDIAAGLPTPDPTALMGALGGKAQVLRDLNRFGEATATEERALHVTRKGLGEQHPTAALAMTNFGLSLLRMSEFDRALALVEQALAMRRRTFAPDHWRVAEAMELVGAVHLYQGRLGAARALFEPALASFERTFGPHYQEIASVAQGLGTVARRQGRYRDALALHERALAIAVAQRGPEDASIAGHYVSFGELYLCMGRMAAAREMYERALGLATKVRGPDVADTVAIRIALAALDVREGRAAQALPALRAGLAMQDKQLGPDHYELVSTLLALADALIVTGDPTGAVTVTERAIAIVEKRHLQEGIDGVARAGLARALWARGGEGDLSQARSLAEAARGLLAKTPEGEERARLERWLAQRR